jgi:4-diphosphocytidyl-2-C-methyl-D-erythritol kinase
MKALFDIPAPAKLNLFLHITGRREDGYHLMQSVFMLVDICDTLHIEARPTAGISREDLASSSGEVLPEVDLVVRAAQLLQQATGTTSGAHIRLQKKIPTQAGMGGGSSDAASCLLGLNRLWNTGLTRSELSTLALRLGADVPFFLCGGNAWAEGIGDQLTRIELAPQPFVVVKPQSGLATVKIFTDPKLKRDTRPATMRGFAECSPSDQLGFGQNDLQAVAESHCPEISNCIRWLKDQHLSPRMTGSGSAVFAPLSHRSVSLEGNVPWQVIRCQSLVEHPLKNWVN